MQNIRPVDAKPPHEIYYGWYVVGACNLIAFITWGVAIFNQGVFLGYYVDTFGWSRATLSFGSTLFHLAAGIAGVLVGRAIDRHGPRAILLGGAFAMAGGALAFGWSSTIAHVYGAFIALSIGFACLHTVTLGKIVARWFVRGRARAMALATFGAGVGGALLVPLNAFALETWGGPGGGLVLAVVTLAVVLPLGLWVIKDGPEALGLSPDGVGNSPGASSPEPEEAAWTLEQAMRTPVFWSLLVTYSAAMLAQSGFLLHQVMFLQDTFGLVGAASVVTATTVAGTAGRAALAFVGSRIASRDLATGAFVVQMAGYLLFALWPAPWSLIAGSALFGLTMGVIVVLQPLSVAECFGQKAFGRIFGPIYMAIRIGSAAGPFIIGVIVATTGDYGPAWLAMAATLALAAVAVRWAVPPKAPSR